MVAQPVVGMRSRASKLEAAQRPGERVAGWSATRNEVTERSQLVLLGLGHEQRAPRTRGTLPEPDRSEGPTIEPRPSERPERDPAIAKEPQRHQQLAQHRT